jgi:hypothetical protein
LSRDVIALLAEGPSRRSLLEAMVAADPDLRIKLVAEGTVVELRDGSGRPVLTVQSAQRLAVATEADRWEDGISDEFPAQPLWVEARGPLWRTPAPWARRGVSFGPPMTPVAWYRIGDGVEPDS